MFTEDKYIKYKDPYLLYLSFCEHDPNNTSYNIVGQYLMVVRKNIIVKYGEYFLNQIVKNYGGTVDKFNSHLKQLSPNFQTVTPENVLQLLPEINKLLVTNYSYTFKDSNDTKLVKYLLTEDPFITEWVTMRIKDMSSTVSLIYKFFNKKFSDVKINYTTDFVTEVLNRIYYPCATCFQTTTTLKYRNLPNYARYILSRCNIDVTVPRDISKELRKLKEAYGLAAETLEEQGEDSEDFKAFINDYFAVEKARIAKAQKDVDGSDLSDIEKEAKKLDLESQKPTRTKALELYKLYNKYYYKLQSLFTVLNDYKITEVDKSIIIFA